MKFKNPINTLIFFSFLINVFGCENQNHSIFSTQLSHDRGSLSILNASNFIGSTVAGTTFEQQIILYSSGGINISNLNASLTTNDPISFSGGAYPGTGGTCASDLPSGETCTLVILYQPVTTQSHSAVIDISYNDALGPGSISYPIYADSHPILQFEYGTQYDFGNKFIGTTTDLRIKVTNVGRTAATSISINNLTVPFSYKGGSYPGYGGNCGSYLNIGATCTLVISYAPTANGQHSQNITFDYINSGRAESSTLSLLAWGFIPADLNVSVSPGVDFGTVAAGYTHTSIITLNYMGGDVSATGITLTGLSAPFARAGGSCGSSLSKALGSCTIGLSLNSNLSGTWTQNFTITYNTGREIKTISRSISGITKQKAVVSFSPSSSLPFGVVKLGQNANQTITVNYVSGEMPATGFTINSTAAPFTYAGGTFPGTGGTCTNSLSSGSCTLVFNFLPNIRNTFNDARIISYSDGYASNASNYTFSGATEAVLGWYLSSGTSSFGDVVVGQKYTKSVRLTATAGTPATLVTPGTLSAPFAFEGGFYPGTGGNCGATISNASVYCNMFLSFSPVNIGIQSQPWSITYFDGIQTQSISGTLTGNGKAAAVLTIADMDFGTHGLNSQTIIYITVTNNSTMAATGLSLSVPAGFLKNTTGQSCTTSLAAGLSCTLGVIFNPTSATNYSGTITLTYNDGSGTRTATSTVSGVGIITSDLYLSEVDNYSFGTRFIGETTSWDFYVGHGGSATPVVINSKLLSLPTDYVISQDTCLSSLVDGKTCKITITFSPTTTSLRTNNLQVNYDNGTTSSVSRKMEGTGQTARTLTFNPTSYDFGAMPTDSFTDFILTVNHSGSSISGTPTLAGSGFSYVGGTYPGQGGTCSLTFSTSSCTIAIRFTPTSATSYSGTFKITYYNGYANTTATIALSGSGSPTAVLTYSTSFTSFGTIIQSLTSTRTITVNHSGPTSATSISAIPSSPFRFLGAAYPGIGGTCGATLSSGTCTMIIEYAPTAVAAHSLPLTLSYNNGTANRTITQTLIGDSVTQAILSKSETGTFDFGNSVAGFTIDKTITLFNAGGSLAANIAFSFDSSAFGFKGGSFPGVGGSCSTQLASEANCTIVIQFKPQSAGSYLGVMTMNYHDGLRTQTDLLDLKGTGT